MATAGGVHDRALLDALAAINPERFAGDVWRITRKGRDACAALPLLADGARAANSRCSARA